MAQRPKPAMAAWIARERKRLGMKPPELAAKIDVTPQTIHVWESYANRRPSPDNIEALERVFGSQAPGAEPGADLTALVSTMRELIDELRLARVERDTAQSQMMQALAAALSRPGNSPGGERGTPEHSRPASARRPVE